MINATRGTVPCVSPSVILRRKNERLVTSPQNFAEFWNVSTRPASARGGYGLSGAQTEQRVRILERMFGVAYDTPAVYPEWRRLVIEFGVSGVQVHDARLVALMSVHQITHILTLNAGDFARYRATTVVAPDQILAGTTP